MKHMSIEYGVHPHDEYKHIKVTWLKITDSHHSGIERINVDYAVETLTRYNLGRACCTKSCEVFDLFDFVRALDLLKPFPQKSARADDIRSLKEHTRTETIA